MTYYDYTPLGGPESLAGDDEAVRRLADRYRQTAEEISEAASRLRSIGSATEGEWVGVAGPKFQGKATELSGRIAKAHDRYAAAGHALSVFAGELADAQADAARAAADARSAQDDLSRLDVAMQQSQADAASGTDADKQAAQQEQHRLSGQQQNAQAQYDAARKRFHHAVDRYHRAGLRAAVAIRDASEHDGLKDSWWYRHLEQIEHWLEVAGVVILIVCVVCFLVACPWALAALPALAAITSTAAAVANVALWVGAGLTAIKLGLDIYGKTQGLKGWGDIAWDVAGLVTFGYGKYAGLANEAGEKAIATAYTQRQVAGAGESVLDNVDEFTSLRDLALRFGHATDYAERFASEAAEQALTAEYTSRDLLKYALGEQMDTMVRLSKLAQLAPEADFTPIVIRTLTSAGMEVTMQVHELRGQIPMVVEGLETGARATGRLVEHVLTAA